jgi:hypothetical protein
VACVPAGIPMGMVRRCRAMPTGHAGSNTAGGSNTAQGWECRDAALSQQRADTCRPAGNPDGDIVFQIRRRLPPSWWVAGRLPVIFWSGVVDGGRRDTWGTYAC